MKKILKKIIYYFLSFLLGAAMVFIYIKIYAQTNKSNIVKTEEFKENQKRAKEFLKKWEDI